MSALQWTNGDEVAADPALDLVEDLDQGATDEEDDLDLGIGWNLLNPHDVGIWNFDRILR